MCIASASSLVSCQILPPPHQLLRPVSRGHLLSFALGLYLTAAQWRGVWVMCVVGGLVDSWVYVRLHLHRTYFVYAPRSILMWLKHQAIFLSPPSTHSPRIIKCLRLFHCSRTLFMTDFLCFRLRFCHPMDSDSGPRICVCVLSECFISLSWLCSVSDSVSVRKSLWPTFVLNIPLWVPCGFCGIPL